MKTTLQDKVKELKLLWIISIEFMHLLAIFGKNKNKNKSRLLVSYIKINVIN